jgi:4-amino-4-deoxy-L-arabinose transferase-like glycosyltransferase
MNIVLSATVAGAENATAPNSSAPFSSAAWQRPFSIWMDGIEQGWAIPLLIVGFVALWMIYLMVAYSGGDLHQDVLETWSLGRSFDWGSSKHPPLMGWAARAWTSVFPLTNWSFQLLALTNSAVALWAIDLISRRFVRGDKRMIVLLLLMLLPIYQLHAQRFNANAVLLSSWPLATYCFLRSFETRNIGWAVAAGATAALAMLGKYYSIFLIGSFVLAVICHPQRRAYFASPAPWIAAGVGLVALAPHVYWLATTGAKPFAYAMERHAGKDFGSAVHEATGFVLALAGIVGITALAWGMMAGRRVVRFGEDFRTMNSGISLLFVVSVGTIVFPALTAAMVGTDMPPLWGLQGVFLFVVLIVCGASYQVPRAATNNLAVTIVGITVLAAFVAAPLHAVYRNTHPLHEGRNFYQPAVAALTQRWHALSDHALPAVGGDEGLAFAAAFYSPDHPLFDSRLVVPNALELPSGASFPQGWAALCYDDDRACIGSMEKAAAQAQRVIRSEFTLQSTLLGQAGASQGFVALVVPPAVDTPVKPSPSRGIAVDFSAKRHSHPLMN